MREIVIDADREMILRRRSRQIVEHRLDHRRREFLRRQTVAAADHLHVAAALLVKRVHAIEIERLASRSGLFRAIEHGDAAHIRRQHFNECRSIERPIEPHFQHADFFILRVEKIDGFVRGLAARAHQHDHALGIGRAVIFEQSVTPAGELRELIHRPLHDLQDMPRKTGSPFRAPGNKRPDFAPCRGSRDDRAKVLARDARSRVLHRSSRAAPR